MNAESSNVVPINPETDDTHEAEIDVRARLRALMKSDKSLTQSRIAKESGLSTTAVSQWIAGIYAGDNPAVEAKLVRWMHADAAHRAKAATLPLAPEYVATPTAEKVVAALRYAQLAGDIAVVYGAAGLGKTEGIKHYAHLAPNVWHATMTPASASVVTALEEIVEAVGAGDVCGGAAKLHRAIVKRIRATNGLLAIDEAQHLSVAALDQIRSLHDATGIGIALVGNEQVYARMTGGNRAAYLDRLYSRIGKRVRLVKSTQTDIALLLQAWNVDDAQCRAQLVEIASKPGGLRGLTKVLRLGAMYAVGAKRALCCDDVRAAWRELGGME